MKSPLIILSMLLLIGCKKNESPVITEPVVLTPTLTQLEKSKIELTNNWDGTMVFNHPNNPFLKVIPANYTVNPNSALMVALMKEACAPNGAGTAVAANDYAHPVYLADNVTPVKDIKILDIYSWNNPTGKTHLQNVPIVAGSIAAGGSDKHYSVINTSNKCVYEFWQFENNEASGGNVIPLHSDGIYQDGRSTVAAGWSQLHGLIWPKEIKEGEIKHALSFAVAVTNANGCLAPATHYDGALRNNIYAIPEGTLVRIKPNVNIDTLSGIGAVEKTIYKAIQKYGMYCGDTSGGGLGLGAVPTYCLTENAYPASMNFPQNIFGCYWLKKFPFDLLEVVNTGPLLTPKYQPYINYGCATWR